MKTKPFPRRDPPVVESNPRAIKSPVTPESYRAAVLSILRECRTMERATTLVERLPLVDCLVGSAS